MCKEITYDSSVTGSKYSKNFVQVLAETTKINYIYEDLTQNNTVVTIFMSSLQYNKINMVEAYSAMALLSDIGGALGLLLGSTILTVVEMIELIGDVLAFLYAKKKKTSKLIIVEKKKKIKNNTGVRIKPIFKSFSKRLGSKEQIYPYVVNVE